MQSKKQFRDAFGLDEFGQIAVPKKISNVKIARLLVGNLMGCSRCFPHGYETVNATENKNKRSWKLQRKTKWKIV
jgi:hypothetical protein